MKTKVSHLIRSFAWVSVVCAASSIALAQRGGEAPAAPFKPTASDTLTTSAGDLKITPVNHAGIEFVLGAGTLYVDPVGNYSEMPKADVILITDIHGDHMNADTVKQLQKTGTVVIAPPEVVKTVTEAKPLAVGASTTFQLGGKSVKVEAVPMYNLVRGPAAGQFFHTKGRGDGFVLEIGGKRVYVAGDTECTPEMKALKNIDVAFLPMNLPFTMTPQEAADCVKAFKPKVVYPYHYRDNDPATEPQQFADALKGTAGVEVRMRNWY